jgi:hypothetical protein
MSVINVNATLQKELQDEKMNPLMYNFKDSMLKAIGEYQVKILVRKKRFKQYSIYI